jgi:ribosomal protein S15P/S13E
MSFIFSRAIAYVRRLLFQRRANKAFAMAKRFREIEQDLIRARASRSLDEQLVSMDWHIEQIKRHLSQSKKERHIKVLQNGLRLELERREELLGRISQAKVG